MTYSTAILVRFPFGISEEGAIHYRDSAIKALEDAGFRVSVAISNTGQAEGAGIEMSFVQDVDEDDDGEITGP